MKRLIASAVALSVIATPAVAAARDATPTKSSKQIKKTTVASANHMNKAKIAKGKKKTA